MGRLIDADALKSLIAGMAISNNYPANKANALCGLIDVQPTAYDVDKVVEQLEELKRRYGIEEFGIKGIICKAIEIVEGGGVNGKKQS